MSFFKEFEDISVREEMRANKSTLELLLDIETEIIKQYEKDERFEQHNGMENEAYQSVYAATEEKLKQVILTPELLQKYVDVRNNTEENKEAFIRGMYSAALLEKITRKPDHESIFINGNGKTFNYLFYHIKQVKRLTLQNVIGNFILAYAGSDRGYANEIIVTKSKGDYLLQTSGCNGSLNHITLKDIEGGAALSDAGSFSGNAKYIIISNLRGNFTLSYAAKMHGILQYVVLKKIKGSCTASDAGNQNGLAGDIIRERRLNEEQKRIVIEIEQMVESMHSLSSEDQKQAHQKIAELQEEIFTT